MGGKSAAWSTVGGMLVAGGWWCWLDAVSYQAHVDNNVTMLFSFWLPGLLATLALMMFLAQSSRPLYEVDTWTPGTAGRVCLWYLVAFVVAISGESIAGLTTGDTRGLGEVVELRSTQPTSNQPTNPLKPPKPLSDWCGDCPLGAGIYKPGGQGGADHHLPRGRHGRPERVRGCIGATGGGVVWLIGRWPC